MPAASPAALTAMESAEGAIPKDGDTLSQDPVADVAEALHASVPVPVLVISIDCATGFEPPAPAVNCRLVWDTEIVAGDSTRAVMESFPVFDNTEIVSRPVRSGGSWAVINCVFHDETLSDTGLPPGGVAVTLQPLQRDPRSAPISVIVLPALMTRPGLPERGR